MFHNTACTILMVFINYCQQHLWHFKVYHWTKRMTYILAKWIINCYHLSRVFVSWLFLPLKSFTCSSDPFSLYSILFYMLGHHTAVKVPWYHDWSWQTLYNSTMRQRNMAVTLSVYLKFCVLYQLIFLHP